MAKTRLEYLYKNYGEGLQDVQKWKRRKTKYALRMVFYVVRCVLGSTSPPVRDGGCTRRPLDFREKVAITV